MRTRICEQLGCDLPIFAFSHCRDVVVEVTRAGGFGVFGSVACSPEELERELAWIDAHVDGRRYGIDFLLPSTYDQAADETRESLLQLIPARQLAFVEQALKDEGVPELPDDVRAQWQKDFDGRAQNYTPTAARRLVEVALRHRQINLYVSALGAPPASLVEACRARNILVGALCGKPDHVASQLAAGVDVVIAQGTEAGGHTGGISTMVLLPQIVEAAGPGTAVLAAGGISRGSQIAACLAMGAQGVWCGTIWLGTRESELAPLEKQVLFAARTEDAVRRRWQTGKTVRLIRSKLSEMWERPDAPGYLPAPLQGVLYHMSKARVLRAGRADLLSFPAGQVVGTMKEETSVRQVMHGFMLEYAEAMERLHALAPQD